MPGRAVLVTGASRGIGAAVARAFAAGGDRVAVHHRSSPGLAREVADSLSGEGHVVVQGDLAQPEEVRGFVDEAADALGGSLDVLVGNAAVYVPEPVAGSRRIGHPVLETSYEDWVRAWRLTVDVDLLGTANACWCAVHRMDRGGRVVLVGSRGAYRGEPDVPAYGAAKAGVHALAQSLAVSLAPAGIAVSAVAPGFVATEMAGPVLDGPGGDAVRAQSPFGRVARVEEVAAAVLHLASPAAEWSSGAVLDLNGASYLR